MASGDSVAVSSALKTNPEKHAPRCVTRDSTATAVAPQPQPSRSTLPGGADTDSVAIGTNSLDAVASGPTAHELRDRLPKVFDALSSGVIDQRKARTIVWQTTHLDDDIARAVTDQTIDEAPQLTTGQLIARIRKLAISVDPDIAMCRYEQAIAERRVVLEPTDDGTANLSAFDFPLHRAAAARRHIDDIARSLRGPGESRSMDQLRADTYLDLLCGKSTSGKGGVVDITRSVIADHTGADWRYTVTHNGQPVATGTTRRRPTAGQRRVVEATHTTCIFPGRRMPATECDLDHRTEWSKSHTTNVSDLSPFCRHDHVGRHKHGWTHRILPNGDIGLTNPLGHTYTTRNRDS